MKESEVGDRLEWLAVKKERDGQKDIPEGEEAGFNDRQTWSV